MRQDYTGTLSDNPDGTMTMQGTFLSNGISYNWTATSLHVVTEPFPASDDTPATASPNQKQASLPHVSTQQIDRLEQEVESGNARAMTTLAMILKTDSTGAMDPVRSLDLLERAATAGDADAMALLADEYETGILVPYEPQKARTLREQAAKAGSQLARWALEEK